MHLSSFTACLLVRVYTSIITGLQIVYRQRLVLCSMSAMDAAFASLLERCKYRPKIDCRRSVAARDTPVKASERACTLIPRPHKCVYVLELEHGFIYVGSTMDLQRRIRQHVCGQGSSFTRKYKPTGRVLPRIGSLQGDGDGPERDETLRQMHRHGFHRVRGWKFVNPALSGQDIIEIESNIREMLDLCRRCGSSDHFASSCPLNKA